MTMKFSLVCFFVFSIRTIMFAQADPNTIKAQAQETATALVKKDYEALLRHTYPKLLEGMGGREFMVEAIEKVTTDLEKAGMRIDSIVVDDPSQQYKAGKEIHCLVPQTVFYKLPDGKMKMTGYLLGISEDDGNYWYFVDTAGLTTQSYRELFTDYNPKLKIPLPGKPLIGKD